VIENSADATSGLRLVRYITKDKINLITKNISLDLFFLWKNNRRRLFLCVELLDILVIKK